MTFTRKKPPLVFYYKIDNSILVRVNEFKDLGIMLDPGLNFHQHIASMVSKSFRNFGLILDRLLHLAQLQL